MLEDAKVQKHLEEKAVQSLQHEGSRPMNTQCATSQAAQRLPKPKGHCAQDSERLMNAVDSVCESANVPRPHPQPVSAQEFGRAGKQETSQHASLELPCCPRQQ